MHPSNDEREYTEKLEPFEKSSLGLRYSKLRDHPLHSGYLWLKGKQENDGADGLWRVHDGIYDFTEFVEVHPGGSEWLKLTKGTDITEAFESHHISTTPETLLKRYFVSTASSPRNSPFTFKEDEFYRVLKSKIQNVLPSVPEIAAVQSKIYTDLLLFGFIAFSLLAAYSESYFLGFLAGVFLSLTAIASHNFFHQKDNYRMYYFNFTLMHYREWRISHALSHHLYTNTVEDLEISNLEPFLQYLPTKKFVVFRYLSWLYSPVVYGAMFAGHFIKTIIQYSLVMEGFQISQLLPGALLLVMYLINGQLLPTLLMFSCIEIVGSLHFGIVGVNAAHHHPAIFHDGDAPRAKNAMDWGIFQMDAVMDRKDITGSHFLVLTNFGDHALHHLFPTIDHGKLQYLYPTFLETCKQFGIEWRLSSQIELVKGQYKQLARTMPNCKPKQLIHKHF